MKPQPSSKLKPHFNFSKEFEVKKRAPKRSSYISQPINGKLRVQSAQAE
ncbi:hypothetical protein [Variovorax boronicumulans]|nr:hypothetical protein [Variovorax boronicumulans]